MEQFTGLVEIQTDNGTATIRLDGNLARITLGKMGLVQREDPTPGSALPIAERSIFNNRVTIDGETGTISVNSALGDPLVTLEAAGGKGQFIVRDEEGRVVLNFTSGNAQLLVGAADHGGDLIVRDAGGRDVLNFTSGNAQLLVGAEGNGGDIIVRDGEGREVLNFTSANSHLYVGAFENEGDIIVRDKLGREVLKLDGEYAQLLVGAAGNEGDIIVRNDNGDDVIHLDGSNGDIILSNADAAEDFELAAGAEATPGTVMVLAGDGAVQPCTTAYDRKVIGVVAGAGAYRPAIVLDRRPGNDARRAPISVMGKVACRADAAYGAIEVGDLLTSSPTAGAAMRAADAAQAFGAVIGKALTPLREGAGLVDMVIGLH
jgi:hypothetical protein